MYLIATVITGVLMGFLSLLFIWSIHVYCQKKCGRKGPSAAQIKKNRAKHGMFVFGED